MSEGMTDDELNERLAKALGVPMDITGTLLIREADTWHSFSPATSVDDLRAYVLPEIERRGLFRNWVNDVFWDAVCGAFLPSLDVKEPQYEDTRKHIFVTAKIFMSASPRVLAEAALKVLEADGE